MEKRLGASPLAILSVITAPDPRLKVKSKPVLRVDDAVRRLMDDMLATMYAAPGVGLAAPQVGVAKRVIVVDVAREGEPPRPLKMANPEIVWTSSETVACEEGCLSVPDQYSEVERPKEVKIRYLDHENEIREIHAEGFLATCLQHEIDHLDGVLFIDRVSSLKRNIILRKLVKARKAAVPVL
jgi:peptide deformylase